MRFALVGDHPDGLDMARALVDTGRHELAVYTGPPVGAEALRRRSLSCQRIGDLEEVLADPAIALVIVAGSLAQRAAQLRRALQSERHVLCVHPADATPDIAYEAAMIQADTGHLLLPLLPETLHPGIRRLAELLRDSGEGPLGRFRLLELERWSSEGLGLNPDRAGQKLNLPGWDVLRALGGEIAEVTAQSVSEEPASTEPLLLAGRFQRAGMFQVTLVPGQHDARWRVAVLSSCGRAELLFPQGWPGTARLTWRDEAGEQREETWEPWNPWPALVQQFEEAAQQWFVDRSALPREARGPGVIRHPTWQDAVRCLELDDAVRRSLRYRRATLLEYPEVSEEVGFKGTMTLVGCGLLWVLLLLLILSAWFPRLGWVVVPLLVGFLVLQLLRWLVLRPDASVKRR